jgi:hypothetical protein
VSRYVKALAKPCPPRPGLETVVSGSGLIWAVPGAATHHFRRASQLLQGLGLDVDSCRPQELVDLLSSLSASGELHRAERAARHEALLDPAFHAQSAAGHTEMRAWPIAAGVRDMPAVALCPVAVLRHLRGCRSICRQVIATALLGADPAIVEAQRAPGPERNMTFMPSAPAGEAERLVEELTRFLVAVLQAETGTHTRFNPF